MLHSHDIFTTLINLCDDIAWGRPADEDALFALTADTSITKEQRKLAEAFGLMLVKIEAREYERNQIIAELSKRNAELEEARKLLTERHANLALNLQEAQQRSLVGQCEAMEYIRQMALSIAKRPINTLVLGPTGSGKEVIAKLIHFSSARREAPFVAVNCTAIPETLFESEMFGIEKGVATGVSARKGLIEEAHGGTLFLDELADMTLANQSKLLRVLESRELMRVGSNKSIPVDIKIIAATNVNLMKAIESGKFREDLYYRINVAEIRLPPLSERGEDILLLGRKFLDKHCDLMGRGRLTLSLDARQCLLAYTWPGNVRELNNEMERAAALTIGNMVDIKSLSPRLQQIYEDSALLKEKAQKKSGEKKHTLKIMRHLNSRITATKRKTFSQQRCTKHNDLEKNDNFFGAPSQEVPQKPNQQKASHRNDDSSPNDQNIVHDNQNIASNHILSNNTANPSLANKEKETYNLQLLEREIILRALQDTKGNKKRAAELLGITREGLRKKLLRMGLE